MTTQPPGRRRGLGGATATVMLPTFRRPEGLARVMRALAAQDDPGIPWDVLVIDNDDPPGAEKVFRAHAPALGVPARYVLEPRRGSAHARNRGIAESTGSVTVMLDDDVEPAAGWLARILAPILEGRCEATGGRVILDPSVPRPRWFDQPGIGGYLADWNLGEDEHEITDKETIVTSNCAFTSEILRATEGFDPELGPRGGTPLVGDDNLVVRRFRAKGGRVLWVPGAIVVHDLPATRLNKRYLLRRAYAQGRSDWILDRELYSTRKLGGARVAVGWLVAELGHRRREGLSKPAVAFHALCDAARISGSLREAAAIWLGRR
jgi:GT2 family glycosyltransferase